ncbi:MULTISPECIES: DUF1294 domain-containing protein [Pseudomonas]|nr:MULTISPECIES: DUF1294 domain-containing protein [Pseudomonas]KAB0492517.1 DUF1294 domain-containing protein [Pseudomonas psychrophila]KMM98566.1 membrane protein [Pseudomonas psychrophila]MBJ2258558.1 DUF1294 domain-containing protein [Pseudomonas psychrophila]MDY7580680.1 DUF1294 domain-containing protein [Pseudomonas sp. CCI3.1]MEB0066210.1 DUF1294 domain-containing protein [Pseudomonas sp. CCI3.1]
MREPKGASIRGVKLKLLVLALLCALPLGGSVNLLFSGGSRMPLLAYTVASLVAFGLYWYDKQQARTGQWRTPENVLHGVELLGGWPGALVAQQVFRHKTRKVSYQVFFWLIVALHQVIWIDVLFVKMTFANL